MPEHPGNLEVPAPAPSPEDVRVQLQRILSSPHFTAAERSKRFLDFVVSEVLAGRGERLKEYTLAVEVFDRDASFDPSTNPIVRVEASRLRRRLEHYYLTLGREDPILIEIPRGTYVPSFQSKPDVLHIQEALATLHPEGLPDWGSGLAGGPWIVVLPFTNLDEGEAVFADGITAEIITALSRFRDFHVIARYTASQHRVEEGARRIAQELGVRYILQGSIRREAKRLRAHAEVVSGATGEVLWAERYERDLSAESIFDIQEEIASHVAATVAQPGGVIVRPETARARRKPPGSLVSYDAILLFHDYDTRLSPETHARALAAVERALHGDPEVASLHAALAILCIDMYRFGFNLRGTRVKALQEGLEHAQVAVKMDPLNPKGYQALFLAHFCHGDHKQFRQAGKRALELNPNDTATLADFGLHLILSQEFGLGELLMKVALRLNPEPPDWYWFAFFSLHFARGEFDEALDVALRAQNEDFYWVHVMHAAAFRKLEMPVEARAAVQRLLALYPDFPTHARSEVQRWMDPARADEVLELLADVGLAKE